MYTIAKEIKRHVAAYVARERLLAEIKKIAAPSEERSASALKLAQDISRTHIFNYGYGYRFVSVQEVLSDIQNCMIGKPHVRTSYKFFIAHKYGIENAKKMLDL